MTKENDANRVNPNLDEIEGLAYSLQYLRNQVAEGDGDINPVGFITSNKESWDAIRKQDLTTERLRERNKNMLHTAMGLGIMLETIDSGDYPIDKYTKFCKTTRDMNPELRQYARYCLRHTYIIDAQTRQLFALPSEVTISQLSFLLMEQDITAPPAK